MSMKKRKDEFEDESKWKPTKCAVCDSCYMRIHPLLKVPTGTCLYGGPFDGYAKVDYSKPGLRERATAATLGESKGTSKSISSPPDSTG